MTNFYNEIDSYAAQWLRNLIAAGHIAPGVVDERSIVDIDPGELRQYTQCHFFAGIGVWSYALRRAGWPDDRSVWTGSCPCQPFSAAGKRKGHEDERHLWPAWARLIRECRPDSILGEQVSGPDGLAWLDAVCTDLEDSRYTVGAVIATAAGVGAPHGRHRIYFMAHTWGSGRDQAIARDAGAKGQAQPDRHDALGHRSSGALAYTGGAGAARFGQHSGQGAAARRVLAGSGGSGGVDDAGRLGRGAGRDDDDGHDGIIAPAAGHAGGLGDYSSIGPSAWAREQGGQNRAVEPERSGPAVSLDHPAEQGLALWGDHQDPGRVVGHEGSAAGGTGPVNGFWADAEWVLCRDPKGPRWRPIEPGSFPVVDGASSRVGRLRAYGNGLCAETAVSFVRAAKDLMP